MDLQDKEIYSQESITEDQAEANARAVLMQAEEEEEEEEKEKAAAATVVERKSHCCKECGKVFSSGKALGGHMSSAHVQAKKDLSPTKLEYSEMKRQHKDHAGSTPGSAGENYCTECGKDFPSKKSLFGHMRCHPDREWRGMHPPVGPKIVSPMASSELLDQENDQDQIDLGPDPGPSLAVVDMGNSLKGWSGTGKRGRSGIVKPAIEVPPAAGSSSEEKQGYNVAVEVLTEWLQQKKNSTQFKDISNNLLLSQLGPELEYVDHFKKQKTDSCMQKLEIYERDESIDDAESKIQNNGNGKVEKVVEAGKTPSIAEKYICNTCEKSFTSHQALGGHRSSHNKRTISIVNAMDEPKKVGKKNDKSYLCNICDNNFSSGQGLGHHKRRFHPTIEEQNIESSTTAEEEVVDFDLNKMPDDQKDNDEGGTQHSKNS